MTLEQATHCGSHRRKRVKASLPARLRLCLPEGHRSLRSDTPRVELVALQACLLAGGGGRRRRSVSAAGQPRPVAPGASHDVGDPPGRSPFVFHFAPRSLAAAAAAAIPLAGCCFHWWPLGPDRSAATFPAGTPPRRWPRSSLTLSCFPAFVWSISPCSPPAYCG